MFIGRNTNQSYMQYYAKKLSQLVVDVTAA